MKQSVSVAQPFLPLFNRSWTFEAWIYLPNVTSGVEYPLVWQSEQTVWDKCLHLLVRNRRLLLGFYSDDLPGTTDLIASRWYHVAFVFDGVTRNQSVYLDGLIDASRPSFGTYLLVQ